MACLVFFAFISRVQSPGDRKQDIKEQARNGEKKIINQLLVVQKPYKGICLLDLCLKRMCFTEHFSPLPIFQLRPGFTFCFLPRLPFEGSSPARQDSTLAWMVLF